MTFVYDKETRSVRDDETGVEICQKYGFRDGVYTFDYLYKHGDLQFIFEVLHPDSKVPYVYHAKNGDKVPAYVNDRACVMEQSLRRELPRAFHKMGKSDPAEADYDDFKKVISEGLKALFTEGGKTLQYLPEGFKIDFEYNVSSFAAKHPGKIKGYVPPPEKMSNS